jgi:hypothetical protein
MDFVMVQKLVQLVQKIVVLVQNPQEAVVGVEEAVAEEVQFRKSFFK